MIIILIFLIVGVFLNVYFILNAPPLITEITINDIKYDVYDVIQEGDLYVLFDVHWNLISNEPLVYNGTDPLNDYMKMVIKK